VFKEENQLDFQSFHPAKQPNFQSAFKPPVKPVLQPSAEPEPKPEFQSFHSAKKPDLPSVIQEIDQPKVKPVLQPSIKPALQQALKLNFKPIPFRKPRFPKNALKLRQQNSEKLSSNMVWVNAVFDLAAALFFTGPYIAF